MGASPISRLDVHQPGRSTKFFQPARAAPPFPLRFPFFSSCWVCVNAQQRFSAHCSKGRSVEAMRAGQGQGAPLLAGAHYSKEVQRELIVSLA